MKPAKTKRGNADAGGTTRRKGYIGRHKRASDYDSVFERMHSLSVKFFETGGIEPLLQEIMDTAVSFARAQKGTLQLLEKNSLRIVAHHGHKPPFLDFFASAGNVASPCGDVTRRGERVVVEDINTSPLLAGTPWLAVLDGAGVKSFQCTPLKSRKGELLGILTTQWSAPHVPDTQTLRRIDMLARQASDMIVQTRAEEALRMSEETFSKTFQSAAAAMALTRIEDGRILDVNDRWLKLMECSRDEVIGTSAAEYGGWKDFADRAAMVQELQTKGFVRNRECTVLSRRGREWTALLSAWPVTIRGEQVLASSAVDITERKHVEEALRESERRLREVIDGSPSPIFLKDRNGKFITINTALEKMLGIKRDELKGKTDYDIATKEMADYWRSHDEQVITTGLPVRIEEIADLPDGHHVFLTYKFPLANSLGELYGVCGISHDITDLKRSEEALRASEREKALILDSANEIIAYHDTENNLVWANRTYLDALGIPLSELKGEKCYRCWGLDRLCDNCPVAAAIQTGQSQEGELTPKNQLHWPADQGSWTVRAAPVKDSAGKVIGAIEIAHDITERKRLEEELRRRQVELQSLFDNSNAGLVLFEAKPPYTVLAHNRYYQELFAEPFRTEGMVGKNLYEYAPEVETQGIAAIFDEVLRTGKAVELLDFPYNSHPPAKSWFNWHLSPVIHDGTVVAFASMSINVTSQHLAEEALR